MRNQKMEKEMKQGEKVEQQTDRREEGTRVV